MKLHWRQLGAPALLLFTCMIPATMLVPVQREIVRDQYGVGEMSVAMFLSVAMIAQFLFSPLAGLISDRLRNRKSFIAAGAAINGLCFLAMGEKPPFEWLFVLRFLEGVSSAFCVGLLLAMAGDHEHAGGARGWSLGLAGSALAIGAALGLPLGGIIGAEEPYQTLRVAGLMMSANAALAALFLHDGAIQAQPAFRFRDLRSAVGISRSLWIPLAFAFADRFTAGFITSAFVRYAAEELGATPPMRGMMLALVLMPMGLFAAPAALLARRAGALNLTLIGSVIYGFALIAAASIEDLTLVYAALAVAGLGGAVMYTPSMLLASRLAPPGLRGATMTAYIGLGSLGFLLAPLLGTALYTALEKGIGDGAFTAAAACFAATELALVLAGWFGRHKVQRDLKAQSAAEA